MQRRFGGLVFVGSIPVAHPRQSTIFRARSLSRGFMRRPTALRLKSDQNRHAYCIIHARPVLPQELAATFWAMLKTLKSLYFQRGLASAVKAVRDASRRNTPETSPVETGKIRGICSPVVLGIARARGR